jgi:hypothetical protein
MAGKSGKPDTGQVGKRGISVKRKDFSIYRVLIVFLGDSGSREW